MQLDPTYASGDARPAFLLTGYDELSDDPRSDGGRT
jgi:hypothetical protein